MSKGEKWMVTRALAYSATSDGLIADNIITRFCQDVAYMEAKFFYGFQVVMENVHAETHAMLIDALVPSEKDQQTLLNWSTLAPSIAFKNIWAIKWIVDPRRELAERLVAFICIQGIFSASSYAAMSWLKSRDKMPGLSLVNDLISTDDRIHIDFACALFRLIECRPSERVVQDIVRDAADVESEFAIDLLSGQDHGMALPDMLQYVRFVSDHLLKKLGYSSIYNVENPYSFMKIVVQPVPGDSVEDAVEV
ncbi:hypothetical protein D9611_008876 [Ephemerocybe angulata]|uniref:Uncharacterized protein n=1 Tax=Ephemerocybe angulata TaxID=980116 RepID=A0A8H5BZ45_9AGAR|nr:hypothetical protein D9611_008876 [Tulosesus angulatus]